MVLFFFFHLFKASQACKASICMYIYVERYLFIYIYIFIYIDINAWQCKGRTIFVF